ncbi:MAG: hypothetical protein ACKV19_11935 [Verrucomicrobiales bacterium]
MTLNFERPLLLMSGVGLIFVLSGVTVFADWALKVASGVAKPYVSGYFWLGAMVYMVSAFLWVPVMKSQKLSVLGAYYSVATMLLLAAVGVAMFDEVLSPREWAGIGCSIVSVILLTQFPDK